MSQRKKASLLSSVRNQVYDYLREYNIPSDINKVFGKKDLHASALCSSANDVPSVFVTWDDGGQYLSKGSPVTVYLIDDSRYIMDAIVVTP